LRRGVTKRCPHRIEIHVSADLEQVCIAIDVHRMEPSFEHVPAPGMSTIEGKAVCAVDPPHQGGQVGVAGLQHEVIVVAHQAEGEGARVA